MYNRYNTYNTYDTWNTYIKFIEGCGHLVCRHSCAAVCHYMVSSSSMLKFSSSSVRDVLQLSQMLSGVGSWHRLHWLGRFFAICFCGVGGSWVSMGCSGVVALAGGGGGLKSGSSMWIISILLSHAFWVSMCMPFGQNRSRWLTQMMRGVPALILVAPYLMFCVMGVSISSSLSRVRGLQLGKSRSSKIMPSTLLLYLLQSSLSFMCKGFLKWASAYCVLPNPVGPTRTITFLVVSWRGLLKLSAG